MKEKLINYGFDTWQVEKLIKCKKLSTGHGIYKLVGNILELTQGSVKRVIEL